MGDLKIVKITLNMSCRWWAKIKVSAVLFSNFEAFTTYSWVADEEQKKRSHAYLIVIFKFILDILEFHKKEKKNLVGGGNSLFNFFKGSNLRKNNWETLVSMDILLMAKLR